MSIGSRIKECRESIGLKQEELAKAIGVTKGAIGNYEANISYPKIENMTKLFEILKTDANYIFQDELKDKPKDIFTESERKGVKKYRDLDDYGKKLISDNLEHEYMRCKMQKANNDKNSIIAYRYCHTNKAAAGYGYNLENTDEWKTIQIYDCPEAHKADFAVQVEGDSMEPTYRDGDIVFIIKTEEVPLGKVGLFTYNGKGYIKEAGKGCMISHNDKYVDIYPEYGEIKAIGRVIGKTRFAD